MRRLYTLISVLLIGSLVGCPLVEAQNRGRGHSQTSQSPSRRPSQSRPGNMGRPSGSSQSRPNPSQGPSNNRPSNNRPGSSNKPTPNRPGNNRPDHNRPGNNRPDHNRPDHNRPGHGWGTPNPVLGPSNNRPGNHRPPTPPRPVHRPAPPVRPYMPAHRPWRRPTPPPHFRPYTGMPAFAGILGLTFGTALGITVNALINSGYNVSGYGNDVVYLSSVPLYNMTWPNATLNYINGDLRGSVFTYSTPGYDMSRYNILYNDLVSRYGYPVSVENNGGYNVSTTWWGANNGYITLSYFTDYANNGSLRYYTTLSIGN